MAKAVTSYIDNGGKLHATPRAATVSDLAALFGSAEGMAVGIATTVLDKRNEIEAIFAELDTVTPPWDREQAAKGEDQK